MKPSLAPANRPDPLDQAIATAQNGRVNVTPAKAIAMAGKLFTEGKYRQAEKVCKQIIDARPANADAHNIYGVTQNALGARKEAIIALRRAAKLAPNAASIHANLGEVLRQAGDLKQAALALETAILHDPANAQALNNLGIIRYEEENYEEAAELYRTALGVRPNMAEAHNNLGNALRRAGDVDGAMQAYQNALVHREHYAEAYNNLGTLLHHDRRYEEAEHALKKAIAQNPAYIEAHNNLALLYSAQARDADALRLLGDALKLAPTNPQTLIIAAGIQNRRSNFPAAEQACRTVLAGDPGNVEAMILIGHVFHETDRFDLALEVLGRAAALAPDNADALNLYGVALKSVGRFGEAREHILKSLELNDSMYGAFANLNDLVDFSEGVGEELFNRMEAIFESTADPEDPQFLPLHYAYAKALDDRGRHAEALQHYITGGRMKRTQLDYNEEEVFGFFDLIRKLFPKSAFTRRAFAGSKDDRPVFIVGMPRSGSTLVEQILASHPEVYGAGEVKHLSRALGQLRDRFPSLPKYPQMMERMNPAQFEIVGQNYLEALTAGTDGAKRVTDKLLTNYFFVGLLHLLYPKAKFVHTVRDPVDTCISAFTKLFKDDMPHSYELGELGRYYRKYIELMAHWEKVLPKGTMKTVSYEKVVANAEKEAKDLIAFLGLEWDDKCLDFHKSDRPVKTASVAQVRKPIYKSAVKRGRKYGDGLKPLAEAIAGKIE